MARPQSRYVCQSCGEAFLRWEGQCRACLAWNSLVETLVPEGPARRSPRGPGQPSPVEARPLRSVVQPESSRLTTGLGELDRVLGGGLVPGSLVLIGGEPGIGKSTLVLQAAAGAADALATRGGHVLYATGEESAAQVQLRANRLGLLERPAGEGIRILAERSVDTIADAARSARPAVLVVDSIQTVFTGDLEGAPGNVGQVRECAARLMRYAKETGTTVFVVGHVTKGGGIAGPKTLEHIVDTVLYFEGENTVDHRVLRATKNRFGSVDEIGVFRMAETGLEPVANPSELFMGDRAFGASGSAVTALLEGSRPLLVEIQGLAAKAGFGTPQRVATGFDSRRLALLLAVLDKRAGLSFAQLDVFLNVVGGIQLREPSGDLAVAAALASSVFDKPLPSNAIFVGEVGLGGEVRSVSQVERRVGEAANMGLERVFLAERGMPRKATRDVELIPVRTIQDLMRRVFV
jgi:DNA repair protein RadA/Sms